MGKIIASVKKIQRKYLIIGVVALVVIVAPIFIINANTLTGEDKIAYELTLQAATRNERGRL